MTCTVSKESFDIVLQKHEVVFTLQCDDGRVIIVGGEYYERYPLPEILTAVAAAYSHCLADYRIER